jgi:hypothetical protein
MKLKALGCFPIVLVPLNARNTVIVGRLLLLLGLGSPLLLMACGRSDAENVLSPPGQSLPIPGDSAALVGALRQGGFYIYFRHGLATIGSDTDHQNLDNCATQRNLDEEGRRQAVSIGNAIRRMAIPVGEILVSEYCRCRQTGELAFGMENVVVSTEFTGYPFRWGYPIPQGEQNRRLAAAERILATPLPAGVNQVIIAHNHHFGQGGDQASGEAFVLQPSGQNQGYRVFARIPVERWEQLAARFGN